MGGDDAGVGADGHRAVLAHQAHEVRAEFDVRLFRFRQSGVSRTPENHVITERNREPLVIHRRGGVVLLRGGGQGDVGGGDGLQQHQPAIAGDAVAADVAAAGANSGSSNIAAIVRP